MPNQTPPDEAGDPMAVASYVASLAGDLSIMARRTGLESLSYLLEMVLLEAESLARQVPRRADGRR
jgi:hypothetical protein